MAADCRPPTFVARDALSGHQLAAGAGTQVEGLPELQVKKPHLQESVDVARGAEVR